MLLPQVAQCSGGQAGKQAIRKQNELWGKWCAWGPQRPGRTDPAASTEPGKGSPQGHWMESWKGEQFAPWVRWAKTPHCLHLLLVIIWGPLGFGLWCFSHFIPVFYYFSSKPDITPVPAWPALFSLWLAPQPSTPSTPVVSILLELLWTLLFPLQEGSVTPFSAPTLIGVYWGE